MSASEQITQAVNSMCEQKIQSIADEYASRLVENIKYEFIIAQMELASSWKQHGYDFRFMPDAFIQNIRVTYDESDGLNKSLHVIIPAENFKAESETKVEFFKKYVVDNALIKLQSMR